MVWQRGRISFCSRGTVQGPIYLPVHWVPVVKRLRLGDDESSPSGAEVKNEWSYVFTPPYAFISCDRENFVSILCYSYKRLSVNVTVSKRHAKKDVRFIWSWGASSPLCWFNNKQFCVLHVQSNTIIILPISTVRIQLHVSVLHVDHLQVEI